MQNLQKIWGKNHRSLIKSMIEWKDNPRRLVLLLRGARQVGKSYLIEKFAEHYFEEFVTINFEAQAEYTACFEKLDCSTILNKIRLLSGKEIIPGKSLLFLDEIQECPAAIQALRYFKEKQPDLHVIGAGSLLEFALNSEDFKMPVGRIEFLYLKPLSFKEFLDATGESHLREFIESVNINANTLNATHIDPVIHERLLDRVRLYSLIGGMPAVVHEYALSKNMQRVQVLQSALLETYRRDFAKYAKSSQHRYLKLMMDKSSQLVGTAFKYSHIDPDIASRELKNALYLLSDAGIFHRILNNTASGIPLKAFAKEQGFKLLFLDIGLLVKEAQIDPKLLLDPEFLLANRGQLAEQWVGQELLAQSPVHEMAQLYYWTRDKKGSMAEVDYITIINNEIIPIEVKAGKTGRLKSLKLFLAEKQLSLGIRISQQPLSCEEGVLSLPFYLVSEMERLYVEARIFYKLE